MSTKNFEQETQSSPWKKVYSSFKVHSVFHGGKKSLSKNRFKNKIFNQIRLITIQGFAYLEVKTQKPEITFLCDISNYTKLRQHTWYIDKNNNNFYVQTNIKKDNKYKKLYFHRMIKPEYKMIDHKNRQGIDNRELNFRETTYSQNGLNKRLMKNNKTGFNGIFYDKKEKGFRFYWYENKKQKSKRFSAVKNFEQAKQKAIDFKKNIDKITKNRNGYDI